MFFRSVFAILYISCTAKGFLDGMDGLDGLIPGDVMPPSIECVPMLGGKPNYEDYAKIYNETVTQCEEKDGCKVNYDKAALACEKIAPNETDSFYILEGQLKCEAVTSESVKTGICVPSACTADNSKEEYVNFINWAFGLFTKVAGGMGDAGLPIPFEIPDGAKDCTFEASSMEPYKATESTSAQFFPSYVSSRIVVIAGIIGMFF
jgi:hypothetical protein